ncbi:hypothetical protein GQ457_03G029240 [Hibiscus cannabinus]
MEDIEDLLVGSGGAPPGFRFPLNAVGVNPRKKNTAKPSKISPMNDSPQIPGTQTIYVKTFGCSHNQMHREKPKSVSNEHTNNKSRDLKELEGVSIVGVQQIDRVVEVVEETLKGHEVRLLNRKTLPALDLPKVRKNKFVEILPINVGCLGACTYCKTKHARGHLGSYTVDSLVERVKTVVADGVREIWLSSEDTGAYGRDIGVNLPILLNAIVEELPPDGSTMLRIGMTNPPFILEHLKEIAAVLRHPCVYSFLHVPVQSGSDAVLTAMNREYTVSEFRTVVDTLTELVPGMQIATDIICGFPGETDEDFAQTVNLIKEYKFPQVHISQFYPRPGIVFPQNLQQTDSLDLSDTFLDSLSPQNQQQTDSLDTLSPQNQQTDPVDPIYPHNQPPSPNQTPSKRISPLPPNQTPKPNQPNQPSNPIELVSPLQVYSRRKQLVHAQSSSPSPVPTDEVISEPIDELNVAKELSFSEDDRNFDFPIAIRKAFMPYNGMEGRVERIWITDIATDGVHLVGHTKGYVQVLIIAPESILGTSAMVKITSVGRWSVFGEMIETLTQVNMKMAPENVANQDKLSPCSNQYESCACCKDPEPCSCGPDICGGQIELEEYAVSKNDSLMENRGRKNPIHWLLRKRRNHEHKKVENDIALGVKNKQDWALGGWAEENCGVP